MKPETINKLAEENSQDIHEFFLASKSEIEKVKRRKKQFTISLVVLCSFSLIGFFFVSLLWRNSEKLQDQIENTSKANAIATKAYTLLEHDPTLAFRLAEESYKIKPTPLNKQVIMAAYAQVPFYEKLVGHTNWVVYSEYSKDGNYIATSGNDNFGRLWDKHGRLIAILEGHQAPLPYGSKSIIFSNNSRLILTCSRDSTARLWNLKGKCLAILKHNGQVNSVCFSPDDKRILTASSDKTARVWDLMGREILLLDGHAKGVMTAKFNFNGKIILTASKDSLLRLWDNYGKLVKAFKGHSGGVKDMVFSPDGNYLLTCGWDGAARLWDWNGKEMAIFKNHIKSKHLKEIDFCPNGKFILTVSGDNCARIWNYKGEELYVLRGHNALIWAAHFSRDGTKISTASDDGTARLWDLEGHEIMLLKGHTSQVFSAQFSPDGKQIVTASGDKTARIWTIEPEENPIFKGHTAPVYDANFSPDLKNIITAGWDYSSIIWNVAGKIESRLTGHSHYATGSAKYDKTGNYIYTHNADETIIKWDRRGKKIKTFYNNIWGKSIQLNDSLIFTQTDKDVTLWSTNRDSIQFFPNTIEAGFIANTSMIYTLSMDSTVIFWKQIIINKKINFEEIFQIKSSKSPFTAISFSFDKTWMATISEDSTLSVWNLEKLISLAENSKSESFPTFRTDQVNYRRKIPFQISSISFSSKENIFITVGEDNIIRLWSIDLKLITEYIGHSDSIVDVNFSSDGQNLVTGSLDKTVRIWDLNGREIMVFVGHQAKLQKAKFSPDGKYILSCSNDHTARLMPVTIEQVLSKINTEKVRGDVYKLSEQELKVYGVK